MWRSPNNTENERKSISSGDIFPKIIWEAQRRSFLASAVDLAIWDAKMTSRIGSLEDPDLGPENGSQRLKRA